MSDREAIEKLLKEIKPCEYCMDYCPYCIDENGEAFTTNNEKLREIISSLLLRVRELEQWIPVSEKTPEEYEKVLTYTPTNGYTKIELIKWFKGDEFSNTTHWRPLPPAPKEGK